MTEQAESFKVKVISPKGVQLEKEVIFVKIPGENGEIGVLKNHTGLLSSLKQGKIRIKNPDETVEKFFIPEGFGHVERDGVVILAPYLEKAEEIDLERAIKAKERAQKRLLENVDNHNFDSQRARKSLLKADSRIDIYYQINPKK